MPEIQCIIGNQRVNVLIDTGSQVTCVNAQFFNEYCRKFKWPTLPVKNCKVRVATGATVPRVTEQVYIPIKVQDVQTDVTALIVPKLIHQCILGVDTLIDWKANIDFQQSEVKLQINNTPITISTGRIKNSMCASTEPVVYRNIGVTTMQKQTVKPKFGMLDFMLSGKLHKMCNHRWKELARQLQKLENM